MTAKEAQPDNPAPQMTGSEFERLYQDHFKEIYRFSLRYARNPETAMDLTQDVFFKAIDYLSRNKDQIQNHRAWLFGIARNHCISSGKKYRAERPLTESETSAHNPATVSFEDDLLTAMEIDNIVMFVQERFSEKEAQIFFLYVLHELSQEEIAEAVALSQSAVSRILISVTEALKIKFKENEKKGKGSSLRVL